MYKSFSAKEYKKHFGVPDDYKVDGFISFGTFHDTPYDQIKEEITRLGFNVSYERTLSHDFFNHVLEFTIDGKVFWFAAAYGGALLSEWLNLACLWGSKMNIIVGSCGGLLAEANTPEIVVPTFAFADESTTRMYEPDANNKHHSTQKLNEKLVSQLSEKHKVWQGPIVTCQAMLAETWEDIQDWSEQGYYGVEMEAATVFAVSNHFKCNSAALLVIGDNLVQEKTVLDVNYEADGDIRQQVRRDMLDAALLAVTGSIE